MPQHLRSAILLPLNKKTHKKENKRCETQPNNAKTHGWENELKRLRSGSGPRGRLAISLKPAGPRGIKYVL